MIWLSTIDHRGQEVTIGSVEDMNAVVASFEDRLDEIVAMLESGDRDTRRAGAAVYKELELVRARIAADIKKVEAIANRNAEDIFHRALAKAIRERKTS
ncbi:MAG: hypothetical protein JOZ16_06515 [Methylobacteriaceae bacterium]|nr:hypothetical protein [Methylobacteriaceae bacterium]MBV9841403.1 hypothetical protein [Sphingomonadaceae bacterium]